MSAEHVTVLSLFPHLTFVAQVNSFHTLKRGFGAWHMKCLIGSTKIDVFIQNSGLLAVYKGKLVVTLFSCSLMYLTVCRQFFFEGNTPTFNVVFFFCGGK